MSSDSNFNSPDVSQVLQEIVIKLGNDSPKDFKQISEQVAKIGEPAIKTMLDIINGSDYLSGARAASILGKLGDAKYINPLIEALKNNKIWAASGLTYFGRLAVAPLLTNLNHENSSVRGAVAKALGEIGDPASTGPLINLLTDKSPEVRLAAIRAFENLGDISALKPLAQLLNDEDQRVRDIANEALIDLEHSQISPNLDEQFKQGSILIAFRFAATRVSYILKLENSGYEVITARNLEQAEKQLTQFYEFRGKILDLVICEPFLWQRSGGNPLERLQSHPLFQDIPFVFSLGPRNAPANTSFIDVIIGDIDKGKLLKKLPLWIKK